MPRKNVRGAEDRDREHDASMRPRPDAAEKPRRRDAVLRAGNASMRPRPDAAEKRGRPGRGPRARACFNEAAARCRGKTCLGGYGRSVPEPASMRPRPDAAEKPPAPREPPARRPARFNEAAARCRGKTIAKREKATVHGFRFNEAAARCRGKTDNEHEKHKQTRTKASMRPRPDAAEKPDRQPRRRTVTRCFNEAAARCRGKTPLRVSASPITVRSLQ